MNKVKIGFFSFTEITDPAEHRSYNEWHQLDHMPEQYPLAGVAFGQRWVSTPACRAARVVDEEPLRPIHYVTLYLMTEPVQQTLDEFMALGQRLYDLNRFHLHRRAHLTGPFRLLETYAAPRVLISAEALPYRPNRGVYVIVEELEDPERFDIPHPVTMPGVAGWWTFGSDRRQITVCYLDDDPLEAGAVLRPALTRRWDNASLRPVFAGPFETIVPWQWDWFEKPETG